MGLGLGTVLGVVAYCCMKSDKARILKEKMSCATKQAAEKAGEWMSNAKDKEV